ncbi:hypothetical protein Emed_007085 [Eimeria media]
MKPASNTRSPKSQRGAEGGVVGASAKKNLVHSIATVSLESAYNEEEPQASCSEREAPTTGASSPRLSDAAYSDTTASDRLSSEELCLSSSRSTLPGHVVNASSGSWAQTQGSTTLRSASSTGLQNLVLQGRVMTDEGDRDSAANLTHSLSARQYTGPAVQPAVGKDQELLLLKSLHRSTGHSGSLTARRAGKSTSTIVSVSPVKRQSFPHSQQPQQGHSPSYRASSLRQEKTDGEKKTTAQRVRAFPKSLANRKIHTQLQGALSPAVMYKYRCSAGSGIQVPVNRLETSPVKLTNWRVSWQELLCYNPRPYNITKGFLENYTVIRGMMETYIHKLTDIVFEDRCTAAQDKPHVYHAYLLPPICPHDWLTATCIQCYTSEDVWLSRGAWKRETVPNSGAKAETMKPTNSKVIPFLPAFTKEEQFEQQRQYRQASANPSPDNLVAPCRLYDSSTASAANKLPLHLWIFLGGKDMQALDGVVLAWKLLRWASEIPPSEFVEASEDVEFGEAPAGLQTDNSCRPSGVEIYRAYHQQKRSPTQDQTPQAAAWACGEVPAPAEAGSNKLSAFGPFLYDMTGVSENSKYRTAFLMVDIPGYGNSSGHPSPCTIRSAAFQAVKHAIQELIEQHGEDSIVLNILGYSLGCAVACSLAADLAATFARDGIYATPSQATTQQSWANIATLDPELAWSMNRASCLSKGNTDGSFDEDMLTFRDSFNVSMYNKDGVDHVCKIHGWAPSAGYSGVRLAINRLILLAPFTSTKAMASKVAASAMGGGFLSRAVSSLVSKQISWDNNAQLEKLLKSLKHIRENTQVTAFSNFRIKILHGDKDNVIPWTMGFEIFNTLAALKKNLGLKIPINFQRLHGETHATILCGASERYLLESCFSPYRLHPAAPLALLKFYSKETQLPRCLPARGMYSSTLSEVREMQMFGPQTTVNTSHQHSGKTEQQQAHSVRLQQSSLVNHQPQEAFLSRANTFGGPLSHQQQAALQLLMQQSVALSPSPRRMPQEQNSGIQHSRSFAFDLGANSLTKSFSVGIPGADNAALMRTGSSQRYPDLPNAPLVACPSVTGSFSTITALPPAAQVYRQSHVPAGASFTRVHSQAFVSERPTASGEVSRTSQAQPLPRS